MRRGKKVGKYGLVATAVTAGAAVGGVALIGGGIVCLGLAIPTLAVGVPIAGAFYLGHKIIE